MFDVEVELLHSTLFEIAILRLNCSLEGSRVRFLGEERESIRYVQPKIERPHGTGARCGRRGAAAHSESELTAFGKERRVLPQTLPALIPGGIVEDRIASTHRRFGASERLPGKSNAWLEGSFVEFNSDAVVRIRSRD